MDNLRGRQLVEMKEAGFSTYKDAVLFLRETEQ